MVYDPMKLANEHHKSMIDHMARARADENCIKQLLVGRTVTTDIYTNPFRVTDVQVKGLEIHIYGRSDPKRRRSILLATHLAGITMVHASKMDATSKEQAQNEQPKSIV